MRIRSIDASTAARGSKVRAVRPILERLEARQLLAVANFATPLHLPMQASADFVAVGDFNGDGKLDLVVSSYGASRLGIRLGNGNGTFQNPSNIALAAAPDFVAARDLNGDGKLDLIVAQFDTDKVSVLRGNGNGTFQTPVSYAAGTGPRAFAIGDFNGDGFDDLVIAHSFEKKLTILRGKGDATFHAPLSTTITSTPSAVIAGDFNGDGKLDIAAADYFTDKINIFLGNGNATFQAGASINVGSGPTEIIAADLNNDGKLDLATANFIANSVSITLGNGDGTFQAAASIAAGNGATFLAAADFNFDNKLDLAVASAHADSVLILLNDGNAAFSLDNTLAVGQSPRSLGVADFNADSALDLVVANQDSQSLSVLLAVPPSNLPVADAGGPYNVNEAGSVILSGSNSTGSGLSYAWDLDGDGIFGETGAAATRGNETGVSPTFSAAGLDGPASRTIWLRVTDANGITTADSASVQVRNVAPTLTISGAGSVNMGQSYVLNLAASDPGNDTIIRWIINWGDGSTQTVNGSPGSVSHVFAAASAGRTISATATDEDGTYSANSKSIVVVDTQHPTATFNAADVTSMGGTAYTFTVTYRDNVGINVSMLDNNDLLVTGPNGFSQLATYVSRTGPATAVVATYRIVPPGGSWDYSDIGTYRISMRLGQVRDTTGNSVSSNAFKNFAVAPVDLAGNTLQSAYNLGEFTAGRVRAVDEFVGASDRNDHYKVTLSSRLQLLGKLSNLTADADFMLMDSGGNRIIYPRKTGTNIEAFTLTLNPGTYYVRVLFAASGGTGYRLRLEGKAVSAAPPGGDDNDLATARDVGILNAGNIRTFEDYVGLDDRHDLYRFTLERSARIYIKLTDLSDNADLQLLNSAGERIAYSKRGGTAVEYVLLDLQPGTYFARVLFAGTSSTSYRLRFENLIA